MVIFLYFCEPIFYTVEYILYIHIYVHCALCAGILGTAYVRCATMEKAVSGFRTTENFPFNPDVHSNDNFAPSLTNQPCLPTEPSALTKPLSAPTDVPIKPTSAPIAVPSQPAEQSRVSVCDISPLPRVDHVSPRKRRAQKTDVLTSSPFKRQLDEVKQKKLELEKTRSKRQEKKAPKKQTCEKPRKPQKQSMRQKKTKTSAIQIKKCSVATNSTSVCIVMNF